MLLASGISHYCHEIKFLIRKLHCCWHKYQNIVLDGDTPLLNVYKLLILDGDDRRLGTIWEVKKKKMEAWKRVKEKG